MKWKSVGLRVAELFIFLVVVLVVFVLPLMQATEKTQEIQEQMTITRR